MVQIMPEHQLSERVARLKDRLLHATPRIDTQKIQIMLEVYRELEGQPNVIKRARVFERLCHEKKIFIDENPLAGTLTQFEYGGYPIPEVGCRWMKRSESFALQRGRAVVSEEDRTWIDRAAEFWWDSNVFNRTRDVILQTHGVDIGLLQKCGCGTEYTPGGYNDVTPDYHKILAKGINGLLSEIDQQRSKLDIGNPDDINRFYFYQAASMALKGLVSLANRYAALAEEMAVRESDPKRRAELERLARTCRWVPANPARDFFEALQSVWFVHLGVWIEGPFVLNCPPSRLTQYLYPFFKKDRDAGKITDEEAIELLQYYFLKINGLAQVLPPHGFAWSQSRLGQHVCLGGYTPDGEDATNHLDWLVLEAQQRLRLPEPLVDLLYHNRMSGDFLMKCVDLIKTGIGQPAMHNIDKAIASHLHHEKMPLEEARNVSVIGCVQTQIPGYSATPWEGGFNTAKMLELALNDGKDPLTGNQLGPHTGDPATFKTYDEFYAAYLRQLEHFITLQRTVSRTAWNIMRDFPLPFASATANDCIATGKDVMDGGIRYNQANGTTFVAGIDTANSLAAIKKLVYEDKKLTMERLKEALAADFVGYEDVQRMCLDAPKYGNDDDYADSIARNLFEACYRFHQRFPDYLGRPSKPEAYSVTVHFAVGRFTGALPSGRKARIPLTDASVSAQPGTDKNGPTALVKSAARVIDTTKWGGNHLNMKFHPSALAGIEGSRKLLSLVKTYFDLGGFHVQFNCVKSETLRDAQLHPDKYRDLVVRVAGFSAFFIHLDREVQDEIIKRTELSFR